MSIYRIYGKCEVIEDVCLVVEANSHEEAIKKAKNGDYIDSEYEYSE